MTIVIDLDRAVELLEAEVAEAGADFIYEKDKRDRGDYPVCRYVKNDAPSCLVAKALFRAGVPMEVLTGLDFQAEGLSTPIADAVFSDDIELSDDARMAFRKAQDAQDNGDSWGEALISAKLAQDDRDL